jgi:N-acetylneuraminic acid mutarotase
LRLNRKELRNYFGDRKMNTQTNPKTQIKRRIFIIWILVLGITPLALSEGTWTRKADIPGRRFVFSSGVVDGKIYAIGGDPGSGTALSSVEAYDPLTDTWAKKTDIPTSRAGAGSSVVDGQIYVIGGGSSKSGQFTPIVQVYDVLTDTWSIKADMPTARGWFSASEVNGKIYAIGGALAFNGTVFSTVEEYDPATDTWTRKTDMPTARACLSTSVVNGKIYAIGGALSNSWSQAVSVVEEYDPLTDTWVRKSDMSTRRSYLSTSALNGKIYAIGGFTSNYNAISSVERYDPTIDVWTSEVEMPTPRWGLSTNAVGGRIYAIGGRSIQGTPFSTVEEYDTGFIAQQPDFNGDGIVDIKDLLKLIQFWGQNNPIVDVAPTFGDGVIDFLDLELLMSYWKQPIDDPTLIAHWSLDEAEGIIAYDSAGVNDAVVVGGTVWQPSGGQLNGALEFDGIDGYAVTGPVMNPAEGPFSVFAWIKGGAPGQVIFSQLNGANWLVADPGLGCVMTELISPAVGRFVPQPLISECVITDGQWHRIGFVWDGANRALYVDDVLVAEDTQNNLSGCLGGLNIGCGSSSAVGTFWSGLIDDVRIYNRAVRP